MEALRWPGEGGLLGRCRGKLARSRATMTSPFHPGEQAIQSRVGVRTQIEAMGQRIIRDQMPEQHRTFFAQQPWLLVGAVDDRGQPHASVLAGAPGFVHAPDAGHMRVDLRRRRTIRWRGSCASGRSWGCSGSSCRRGGVTG